MHAALSAHAGFPLASEQDQRATCDSVRSDPPPPTRCPSYLLRMKRGGEPGGQDGSMEGGREGEGG